MHLQRSLAFLFTVFSSECFGKIEFTNVSSPLVISVNEEEPINTTIAILNATSDATSPQISYEIKSQGNEFDNHVTIDPHTGRISNIALLDFEKIKVITFNAYASDGIDKVTLLVVIQIHNINDNVPKFQAGTLHQFISEDVNIGDKVAQLVAVDDDQIDRVFYSFTNQKNDTFEINADSGIITSKVKLDYEKRNIYTFNISATDGEHKTNGTLILHVTDADDQGCRFNQTTYYASLDEGSYPNGKSVVDVYAYDLDIGRNDSVVYSLVPPENSSLAFLINSATGTIHAIGNIDYETDNTTVVIQVNAKSTTHPAVQASVILTIKDVNDNSPNFTQQEYHGRIAENSLQGRPILNVTAQDKDSGANNVFKYYIGNKEVVPFTIMENGEIRVNGSLDRETKASYTLQIVAEETNTKEKYKGNTTVFIEILDANDNTPHFRFSVYLLNIKENIQPPVILVKVTAVDDDTGLNSQLRYSIDSNSTSSFVIDPVTGALATAKVLDREQQNTHRFKITVTDLAPNGQKRSSTALVFVNVGDENDNSPTFEKGCKNARIGRSTKSNTAVTTVEASDPDLGANSEIKYTIIEGNSGGYFSIDSSSGIIRTNKLLDNEQQGNFTLVIQAQDGGNKMSSCKFNITVFNSTIKPALDIIPPITFSIKENNKENVFVGNITNITTLGSKYGQRMYSLLTTPYFRIDEMSGAIYATKKLDRESEAVHRLVIILKDTSPMSVDASPSISLQEATVNVLDEDDNPPIFIGSKNVSLVRCREALSVGSTIYTFTAEDRDIGENAKISYTIDRDTASGNVRSVNTGSVSRGMSRARSFGRMRSRMMPLPSAANKAALGNIEGFMMLNESTGELKVKSEIPSNFESKQITIKATSKDQSDTTYFKLSILPSENTSESDNNRTVVPSKTLITTVYHGSVSENSPEKTNVGYVKGFGKASNEIGVNYTILYGDDAFEVNSTTGLVRTTKSLDFEEVSYYTLVISISSESNSQQIAIMNVIVRDINDNAPYFTKNYTFTLKENEGEVRFHLDGIGDSDTVGSVLDKRTGDNDRGSPSSAVPPQLGGAGRFQSGVRSQSNDVKGAEIEIASGKGLWKGLFEVSNRYLVTSNKSFDFETQQMYRLKLKINARDKEKITGPSECWVTIHIEDLNDNPPIFNPTKVTKEILHTAPIGTLVGIVQATDKDISSVIEYEIVAGNEEGLFSLEKNTSRIFTRFSLPASSTTVRRLIIEATDQKYISRVNVSVIIIHSDDIIQMYSQEKAVKIKSSLAKWERDLSKEVNGKVKIVQVGASMDGSSVLDLYGVRDSDILTKETLVGAAENLKLGLTASPGRNSNGGTSKSSYLKDNEERNILLGVLIAVSSLLVIFCIASLCMWVKKKKRQRSYVTNVTAR